MKKLKIAIIEPVGSHGGMDYYDFGLCRGLAEAGIEVTLYTSGMEIETVSRPFSVKCFYRGVYGSAPAWRRGLRYLCGTLCVLIDLLVRKTRVCHFHFFHIGLLEFTNVLLARLCMRRVVVTVHDVEAFVEGLSLPVLARWCYQLSHKIVVHNQVSMLELKQRCVLPESRSAIIPHGNYLPFIDSLPSQKESRRHLGVPEGATVLLFFGQIKEVKGLDLLLEALPEVLESFPNTYLLIAGKTWKTDFSRYQKIITEKGLTAQCLLHIGYVPNDEVSSYYAASDLVVLPYRRIYQSGVLLMAMSYGKSVLASDLQGMAEVVTHGETGFLFKAGDSRDMATVLKEILKNPQRLLNVAKKGRQLMENDYSWDKIGRATREVYDALER